MGATASAACLLGVDVPMCVQKASLVISQCNACSQVPAAPGEAERLRIAQAAFDRLGSCSSSSACSSGGLSCLLPRGEREIVKIAVDEWSHVLSSRHGCALLLGGRERQVKLSTQPLALVVDQGGAFPVSFVEHIRLRSTCLAGHVCEITFARNPWDDLGRGGAGSQSGVSTQAGGRPGGSVLDFSFSRRAEQIGFALCIRVLHLLVPDLQGSAGIGRSVGSASVVGSDICSSEGSLTSRGSTQGRRSQGHRRHGSKSSHCSAGGGSRKPSKSRAVLLHFPEPSPETMTNASTDLLSAIAGGSAVEDLEVGGLVPSRAELQEFLDDEERVDAADSPSARMVRPLLPEFLRPEGGGAQKDRPLGPDAEYRSPDDSPSAKSVRRHKGGLNDESAAPHNPKTTSNAEQRSTGAFEGSLLPGDVCLGSAAQPDAAVDLIALDRVDVKRRRRDHEGRRLRRFHELRKERLAVLIGCDEGGKASEEEGLLSPLSLSSSVPVSRDE